MSLIPFLSKLYKVRSTVGAKHPDAKHTYRYHVCTSKYTSKSRLTVCQASENSSSKMAVLACGTLSYFHYIITRVLTEISAHGEISSPHEQYQNSLNVPLYFLSFFVAGVINFFFQLA